MSSLNNSDKTGLHISLICFTSIIDHRTFIYRLLLLPILCLSLFDLTIVKLFNFSNESQLNGIFSILNLVIYFYFYCCVAYRWICYLTKGEINIKLIDNYLPNKTMVNFSIELIGFIMLTFAVMMAVISLSMILQPMAAVIFFILFTAGAVYLLTPLYIKLATTANELPIKIAHLFQIPNKERRHYFSLAMMFVMVTSIISFILFLIIGILFVQILSFGYDISQDNMIEFINLMDNQSGLALQFIMRLVMFSFSFITMMVYIKFISILYFLFIKNRAISSDV